MARFISTPFATSGDKKDVPNAAAEDGAVSYSAGYGPDYSKDPNTDIDAKRIEREEFNGILNDLTGAINELQLNGAMIWRAQDIDGKPISYPAGAIVVYTSDSGTQSAYISLVAGNTANPVDTAKWAVIAPTAAAPAIRKIIAGTGLTGGGDLSQDRTLALNDDSIESLAKADSSVQPSRKIIAGDGLAGGGDLSEDVTILLDESTGKISQFVRFGFPTWESAVIYSRNSFVRTNTGAKIYISLKDDNTAPLTDATAWTEFTPTSGGDGGHLVGGAVMFTTAGSHSWTVPDGITQGRIKAQAGGGGGGGGSNDNNGGDGGNTVITGFMTCNGGKGGNKGGEEGFGRGGDGGSSSLEEANLLQSIISDIPSSNGDNDKIQNVIPTNTSEQSIESIKIHYYSGKGGQSLGPYGYASTGGIYSAPDGSTIKAKDGALGGGGGGGSQNKDAGSTGGGGGAGGYAEGIFKLTPGQIIQFEIGDGGSSGGDFAAKGGAGYVEIEWGGIIDNAVPATRKIEVGQGIAGGGTLNENIKLEIDAATFELIMSAKTAVQKSEVGALAYEDKVSAVDIDATIPPAGSISLFSGSKAPAGWKIYENPDLPKYAGLIYCIKS